MLALIAIAPVRAELIDFSVRMDAECAGAISTAIGSGVLQLDTDTGILSYNIDFVTEFDVQFTMFHGPFEDGCGGPPFGLILYWFPDIDPPYIGTTEHAGAFTDVEMRELVARLHYVNVHTTGWPDAELRGYVELSRKSRYVTWHPWMVDDSRLTTGSSLGLRVTVVSLPHAPAAEGRTFWAGAPASFPEEDSSQPGRTFTGSVLQCSPHLTDWSALGSLHITGGEIMPDATYRIELYDPACGEVNDPACYFGEYVAYTSAFADVVAPLAVADGGGQPDFRDINAQVMKFLADPAAPTKAAAHLVPNTPSSASATDFKTISASVQAFLGVPFTQIDGITGPCACPSSITCGTSCAADGDCPGGVCFNGECAGTCGRCTP